MRRHASRAPIAAIACVGVLLGGCASAGGPSPDPDPSALSPTATTTSAGGSLLVTLFPGPPQRWNRTLAELHANYGVRPVALWPMESLGVPCVLMSIPPDREAVELTRLLNADPRVESAQPVYRFRALGYDDPYAQLQHSAEELRFTGAHRWATGKGVKVAVVDTGVDFSHPDLVDRVVGARDFVNRVERVETPFSGDVHGTGVAGVIAASAGNGEGIVGVAPEAELLAVRSCWPEAPERIDATCDSYTLAQGLDFAIDQGARVINLSLAGPRDPLLSRLLEAAMERGTAVVAAAEEANSQTFPASEAGVLAVGTQPTDEVPDASEGPPPLTAPGVDILTTVPRQGYDFLTGNSLAAAHVSGVAALLLERRPDLAPGDLAAILERTARASNPHGAVIVDACAALADLEGEPAESACDGE
ncbi:MAG: S8 family peptidase [Thermoanaerobaculia bacterium]